MSASDEVNDILNYARSSTSALASSTTAIVNTAIAAISQNLTLSDAGAYSFSEQPVSVFTVATETPPAFPLWAEFAEVAFPSIQEVDEIKFESKLLYPQIFLPSPSYGAPTSLADFTKTLPLVDTDLALPDLPSVERTVTLPEKPILAEITVPELTLSTPIFATASVDATVDPNAFQTAFQQFSSDIFNGAGGLPGLESLLADQSAWSDRVLNTLMPLMAEQINQRFAQKYAPALAFQTQLQQRLTDRLNDEQQRAALQDRSGWDLPQAVRQAMQATLDQIAYSWKQHAASQVATQAAEQSLAVFEAYGALFEALNSSVQRLKSKEIEYVLEAHRMAIAYAKRAVDALLAQYEIENFTQQEVAFKNAEAQLQVFEAELKVALLRYDIADARLQVEQAKQDNDTALIRLYQTEMEATSADIQVFASQVAASRTELELKTFPIDAFVLEVKTFEAKIAAYESRIDAQIANLQGDSAQVEAELAKVKLFEGQVQSYEKVIETQKQIMAAQSDRNTAVVGEFTAAVDGQLYETKKALGKNRYDLSKYQVLADDSLEDAKLELAAAQAVLKFNQENQANVMKAYRLTKERNLELLEAELDRITALSNVNAIGAATMAKMATGAMSAATGIANVVIQETA
jgi:hypothetical protein